MIPQSPEIQKQILQQELDSVEENLEVLTQQGEDVSNGMLKGVEKRKANLEAKIKALTFDIENRKDDVVDFKLMGIDHLLVDNTSVPKNWNVRASTHSTHGRRSLPRSPSTTSSPSPTKSSKRSVSVTSSKSRSLPPCTTKSPISVPPKTSA